MQTTNSKVREGYSSVALYYIAVLFGVSLKNSAVGKIDRLIQG